MEQLVSKANGGVPVQPLKSNNIHSTDDSSIYFVAERNEKKEYEWRIAKDGIENNGVRSNYQTTPTSAAMGTRVRLTWTASADGTVAPAFVTYTGLNERELPTSTCPTTGVLVLSLQGLTVGIFV